MSMPIQRQSDQFSVFDTGTRWERDRGNHDIPKGLAALVNTSGPRIQGGLLNTRTAGWHYPEYDPRVDGYPEEDLSRPTRAELEAEEREERDRDRDYLEALDDRDPSRNIPEQFVDRDHLGAVAEDHSGGDEDDPDWIREHSPRQQETNRKRGEEISRSKEMFARRATGRLPFDRTAGAGPTPGPLVDSPLYDQDPEDYFGRLPYSGPYCPDCDRPMRWVSGPGCRHSSHVAGIRDLLNGGMPKDQDVSWEQTDDGWTHPATGARINRSGQNPDEWEMLYPANKQRYTLVGRHPDPQVLMQSHDWETGHGPAPEWHGKPKWHHWVEAPPLPAHTSAAAPAPVVPGAHGFLPGHRVGVPWRGQLIPGIVTDLDGSNVWVRWHDGQYTCEEPPNLQLL